jgi:hypothetical protein
MQNNDFHRTALTAAEARGLAAKVATVIEERDCLRAEVSDLRQILDALESLRELLENDVSGAVTARAMSNGHFGAAVRNTGIGTALTPTDTAHTGCANSCEHNAPTDTADDEILELEATTDASVHILGCGPEPPSETAAADRHEESAGDDVYDVTETDADERREQASDDSVSGVAETDDAAPETDADTPVATVDVDGTGSASSVSVTPSERETLPPVTGHTDRQDGLEATVLHAGKTQGRPPQGSLMLRILECIENSTRPKRPWQLQRELMLSRTPSAELSRLVGMGCIERIREGIYGIPGKSYDRLSIEGY